jgi:hypothetical protein
MTGTNAKIPKYASDAANWDGRSVDRHTSLSNHRQEFTERSANPSFNELALANPTSALAAH